MDETYLVRVTEQAQEQLYEIKQYVATCLQAPDTAQRLLKTLQDAMISLDRFPGRIALTEEEPWRSEGIRKMPVQNFLIYYWIDEENHRVQVTAVLYGKCDQARQLAQMDRD